jgi:FtsP/CotA-like multicopper oxidase with cupredoxin domain
MIGKTRHSILLAAAMLAAGSIYAQTATKPAAKQAAAPAPPANSQIKCLPINQALPKIPELISSGGRLRATVTLISEKNRIPERYPLQNSDGTPVQSGAPNAFSACWAQWVRAFRSPEAVPAYAEVPAGGWGDPMPGPTLRARVGDMIELTFLNNVDPAVFNNSRDGGAGIDRGDQKQCDDTSAGYPGEDTYPNCFHGSTTANIHFHGTHTNPNTTGDNVFLEILSSQRVAGTPPVKPGDVKPLFDEFFRRCEVELGVIAHREWPRKWTDLPKAWTDAQKEKLQQFDSQPGTKNPVWPVNEQELAKGAWPQYYIGSYPYCFRVPEYRATAAATDTATPSAHAAHTGGAGAAEREGSTWSPLLTEDPPRLPLQMGQAPGTHWYHAHKHGSTTINVSNGMTGVFIIEGAYDDRLNENYKAYGEQWTRKQPVLLINQLGTSPNLMKGAGQDRGPDFSVNGRINPVITMAPGEVQMWRIVNSSSRAGVQFSGPPAGFHWRQLAQDGVQFKNINYVNSADKPFLLASGNRADILIQAPDACTAPCAVQVRNTVNPSNPSPFPINLITIKISGTKPSPPMEFIETAPDLPDFLADIPASAVKATKTIDFSTVPQGNNPPKTAAAIHKIDGKQFDGDVGALVRLNTVEEWTIRNFTSNIAHPFHIHINPFQVVEQFQPNDKLADGTTARYITDPNARTSPDQCLLDPKDPDTWKPCTGKPSSKDAIWWDVFPIPTGLKAIDANKQPINDPDGQQIVIPGYFKMRSRFVDYAGFYVIHCHILAHEDRGMMTVVEVAPSQSPYSHH